jgi:DNA-binding NtrC family response regulator
MPIELQPNLLLPIEQKVVRRVGSVDTEAVDIRFISATDRDLVTSMTEGRFREQLYHRLRECEIAMPSLRERVQDIPLIIDFYVRKHNKEMGDHKGVSPAAIEYLQEYEWPGNVRELSSVLRVALQTTANEQLEVTDLNRIIRTSSSSPVATNGQSTSASAPTPASATNGDVELSAERSLKDDLAMVDKIKIEKTLERVAGNVSKAAGILGVSRETLHNKIRKYGIDVHSYRSR